MPDFVDTGPPDEPPKKKRRRSSQRADTAIPPPGSAPDTDDRQEPEPPRQVNGKPNRAFYVYQYGLVNRLMFNALRQGESLPFNYDGAIKGILAEAKMAGIDPDNVVDDRGEDARLADALDRYIESPESIWEDEDATLELVKARMDKADEMVRDHLRERVDEVKGGAGTKKLLRLRDRISLVLSLRNRARKGLPDGYSPADRDELSASWLLRFMLYVGRSNIPSDEPGGTVFRIGHHHAKIAWDIYEAQNGIDIQEYWESSGKRVRCGPVHGVIDYKGVVIVAPPGHGKSEIACHFTAREICLNPELQAIMLHAISEKAQGNLRYVANCFSRENSVGRRCMALFPVELAQSNNQKMRVKLDRPLNQSTLEAYGFMSGRLGINTILQIWDDIVPQSDANEEATRGRRFERLGGTWLTRQRGKKTFVLCIGTFWHHADAVMRLIELVKSKKVAFRVSIQRCGGPKDTPAFYPLWNDVYDQKHLRAMFATLGPNIYSAAYQSNPRSDSARIVRRLRYYDATTVEHAEFRKRAINYLSLDPSGTNRAHSDKAGLVYAACGELAVPVQGGDWTESRQVLRIVDAKEFGATQTDLVEFIRGYAANNNTNYVLVEQAGMSAIADMLRDFYGIDAIPLSVGQKNKEIRLRNVAAMLDEGQSDAGGPTACVEFPGVVVGLTKDNKPVLGPDPAFKWMYDQILDFGVAANDHALDAVTQLSLHLKGDLRPGLGAVTEQIHRTAALSETAMRKQAMLGAMAAKNNRTADEDDVQWFTNANKGGW